MRSVADASLLLATVPVSGRGWVEGVPEDGGLPSAVVLPPTTKAKRTVTS